MHWFFTYPWVYCESSSYLTCHIWPLETSRSLTWEEKRKKIFSWDFGVWSLKMDANWKALEVEIFWVGFSVASWWMGKNVWSEEGFRDIKTPTWISNSRLKKNRRWHRCWWNAISHAIILKWYSIMSAKGSRVWPCQCFCQQVDEIFRLALEAYTVHVRFEVQTC